jgi:hypothetical protein
MARFENRRAGSLFVAAVLALDIFIGAPHTARAAINPCDAFGTYQEGYAAPSNANYTAEGVSTSMTYEQGNICTTDTGSGNDITSWSMVYSRDRNGWAQSGLLYRYGWACWRHWSEQSQTGVSGSEYFIPNTCVGNGEVHQVWQQIVPTGCTKGTNCKMRSNIDTTVLMESSWDPFANWAQPFSVGWAGEAHHNYSDIPGYNQPGYPPKLDYSSLQFQQKSNDSFLSVCGALGLVSVTASRYAEDQPACDHVRTWTSG